MEDFAVGTAPGVLPISCLVGEVGEVGQTEVMVLADLHAPKAQDQGLRLVVGRPVRSPIRTLMIDPPHRIAPVQQVGGIVLISWERRPWGDKARRQGADVSLIFAGDNKGQAPFAPIRPARSSTG